MTIAIVLLKCTFLDISKIEFFSTIMVWFRICTYM